MADLFRTPSDQHVVRPDMPTVEVDESDQLRSIVWDAPQLLPCVVCHAIVEKLVKVGDRCTVKRKHEVMHIRE